ATSPARPPPTMVILAMIPPLGILGNKEAGNLPNVPGLSKGCGDARPARPAWGYRCPERAVQGAHPVRRTTVRVDRPRRRSRRCPGDVRGHLSQPALAPRAGGVPR